MSKTELHISDDANLGDWRTLRKMMKRIEAMKPNLDPDAIKARYRKLGAKVQD